MLPVFIEKAGTGGGLFRLLQSQGCTQAAELLSSPEVRDAAIAAERCATAWQELARHASATRPPGLKAAGVARAAAVLPDLEENLMSALQHASESLVKVVGDVRVRL